VRPTYRETVAVYDCTFAVESGKVVAFPGPNGAGKSTTIKMLTGILSLVVVEHWSRSRACASCAEMRTNPP
jgi:ABC-type multidrug transport system ATPase subunit